MWRSQEPQQCGGAHASNTLSSPNAAPGDGIGGPPEHSLPDDPHPKSSTSTATLPAYRTAAPTPHQTTNSPNVRVRGSPGAEPPGRGSAAAVGRRHSRENAGETNERWIEPRRKSRGKPEAAGARPLRGGGRSPPGAEGRAQKLLSATRLGYHIARRRRQVKGGDSRGEANPLDVAPTVCYPLPQAACALACSR